MKIKKILSCVALVATMAMVWPQQAHGLSLALDSIAEWGKFPRFCVDTYRWGCNFFNGYDTTYVVGTGYKFNVKATGDSWLDAYNFRMPENQTMMMNSDPSTSVGVHLTYLAVSVGYDINVSRIFGHIHDKGSRRRWRFGFNCALFAAEMAWTHNTVGTTIRNYNDGTARLRLDLPFDGVSSDNWNLDFYYFFNNKRYSEAGAFNYSRIQLRNQGSWFAGLSFSHNDYNFDFSSLPQYIRSRLPQSWDNYRYNVSTNNYCVRVGYGYNWVFAPGFVLGVSESPILGMRSGVVTGSDNHNSFSLYNRMKASVVWNNGRWFAGIVTNGDMAIVYDRETTMSSWFLSGEVCFGCRFNLW